MAPQVGEPAPEFRLPSTAGGEQSLSELLAGGEALIVAFYPKDNTAG